jgi:hypothetical protein
MAGAMITGVEHEERIEPHVAVVARDVGGRPDRLQHAQIVLHDKNRGSCPRRPVPANPPRRNRRLQRPRPAQTRDASSREAFRPHRFRATENAAAGNQANVARLADRGSRLVMAMRRVCPKDGSDTAALSRIATAMRAEGSLRSMGSLAFGGAQRFGVCFVPYRRKLRADWKGKCLLSSAPPPDGELGRRWLCFSGLGAWRNICSGVRPATPINGRTYISALSRTAAAYIHH